MLDELLSFGLSISLFFMIVISLLLYVGSSCNIVVPTTRRFFNLRFYALLVFLRLWIIVPIE